MFKWIRKKIMFFVIDRIVNKLRLAYKTEIETVADVLEGVAAVLKDFAKGEIKPKKIREELVSAYLDVRERLDAIGKSSE